MLNNILPFIAALVALLLGLKLPDIDLAPLAWRHRSAWTHGPLWAILLPVLPLPWWCAYVPAAALIGITIHLAADARPRAWRGASLINTMPLRYTFKPWMSFLYILGSCIFSCLTVWRMLA